MWFKAAASKRFRHITFKRISCTLLRHSRYADHRVQTSSCAVSGFTLKISTQFLPRTSWAIFANRKNHDWTSFTQLLIMWWSWPGPWNNRFVVQTCATFSTAWSTVMFYSSATSGINFLSASSTKRKRSPKVFNPCNLPTRHNSIAIRVNGLSPFMLITKFRLACFKTTGKIVQGNEIILAELQLAMLTKDTWIHV